ncbi:MAG: formimidoylglutamate deiminase [Pseudomonadota bacterium]
MHNEATQKSHGRLRFEHLLEGVVWRHDRVVEFDESGLIDRIRDADPRHDRSLEPVAGLAVPGMPNLHSHAFQRAMAGLAEYRQDDADSFWTWRELMYAVADRLSANQIETVARHLYGEMLEAGYTSVAEFHYLHRPGPDVGAANPLGTATDICTAAKSAGIAMTLLPVCYQKAGFGDQPASEHQRRFTHGTEAFIDLWHALAAAPGSARMGLAFHSLRAVDLGAMRRILDALPLADRPIHIHVAEQPAEVAACLAHTGRRPVALLAGELGLDPRWCLIHATHVGSEEIRSIAAAGATVGLCPTTEGNLGDGLFPMDELLAAAGSFGIGSDSHVTVDPLEELRWLEYGQRLRTGRRNVVEHENTARTGTALWAGAAAGGARALGIPAGTLAPHHRADIAVFDGPGELPADIGFDRCLFSGRSPGAREVYVAGRCRVAGGSLTAPQDPEAFAAILDAVRGRT